jgi:hypothetical protein
MRATSFARNGLVLIGVKHSIVEEVYTTQVQ